MFNYMNSKERVQFSQDVYNAGAYYDKEPITQPYTYEGAMKMYLAGDLSYDEFMKRKTFLSTVNTDWFDLLTRSAVSHSHNVSLAGGTEAITYNVSLGYNNTLGQEIGNSNERMTREGCGEYSFTRERAFECQSECNFQYNKGFWRGSESNVVRHDNESFHPGL